MPLVSSALLPTRCHKGHWLGADPDVHAAPQHRGQAPPVHQVSRTRSSFASKLTDVTQPGQAHPSLKKGMLDVGWDAMGEWLLPGSGALPHSLLLFLCSSALMESLINPLQDRIEDWKKTANQLDKDHAKGTGGTGWIRAGWLRCWAGSTLTALLHPQSTSEHAMRSRKSPLTPSSSRKRLAKVRGGLLGGAPTSPSAAPPA